MSIFIGSDAGDTITPELVSRGVIVIGAPKTPSAAVDLILGGSGNDTVAGGRGDDFAFLGAGDDTFIWRPGDGNDFVDGEAGTDRLDFNGSSAAENITVSAGLFGLARVDRDVGNVTMNLDRIERIEIAALDGQDRITVNDLGRTDVKDVAIDLAGAANPAAGDGQSDLVVVNGSQAAEQISVALDGTTVMVDGLAARTQIDHADATDQLVIHGGAGDDTISAATLPAGSIELTLDGGAGNDTLIGGGDADVLLGGDGDDLVIGGRGADVAQLGAGDDVFVWNPGDGSDTVEGQDGLDTLRFNGANIGENIDISANGARVLFHRDVGNVTMDLNGVEQVNFAALGGADAIVVHDLSGTAVSQVDVDLAATLGGSAGDGAADAVEVDGTNGDDVIRLSLRADGALLVSGLSEQVVIEHFDVGDTIHIDGAGGDDIIDASALGALAAQITLEGGDGDDILLGGGGDDTLLGNAGDDILIGGAGLDTLDGGTGENILFQDSAAAGANGTLTLFGDGNDDRITVSRDAAGRILVNGGAAAGNPTVANTGLIEVFGGGGNDIIALDEANGALPAAALFGGAGNDTLTGGSSNDELFGGSGDDTLLGKGGNDLLFGGAGNDVLTGGTGDDQMFGQAGNDRMIWNPGEGTDLMEGGAGDDTAEVNGGNGAETFTITANGTRVRFDRVSPAPFSLDIGTTEHLVLNANGGDDVITAGNGLSTLIQLTLDGGAGNDTITGGDGNDTLIGGDGNDLITGGRGSDLAFLGAGDDSFVWNPGDGSDTVEGGDGTDTMLFNGANINEKIDISANGTRVLFQRDVGNVTMDVNEVEQIHFAALGGQDNIAIHDLSRIGVAAVDVDLGSSAATADGQVDTIAVEGSDAAESVEVLGSGSSVDVVGLSALVSIEHADATDQLVIHGGAGDDTISAATLPAGSIELTLDGGAGNDTLIGGGDADVLLGGDGDDLVIGGRGADAAQLGAGDDVLVWNPGDGSDVVEGGDGSDALRFNGANIGENIDISASGDRVHFFRDVGNVTMDLKDVEHIDFAALGGQDSIVVNDLSGTDATQVDIDLAGPAGAGDGAQDRVTVVGGAGADAITVAQQGEALIVHGLSAEVTIEHAEASDQLLIDGGAGDDTIDASGLGAGHIGVQLQGGDGVDRLIGSAGNDVVIGGRGNDVAMLAAGDDAFVWNPGDGSDTVEGQDGLDTLQFNGANIGENIDISANGARVLFHRDVGNVTMDLNGVEQVNFAALGGQDSIEVRDVSGTDVKQVAIDLAAPGTPASADGQLDRVTLDGTAGDDALVVSQSGSAVTVDGLTSRLSVDHADAGLDSLAIEGGEGNDVIDASGLPAASVKVTLDGGGGNDVLRGGAGDDVLSGGDGDDILDGGGGNDVLTGGAGDDIFRHGQVTIEDFHAGAGTEDKIDLHGVTGATDFASVMAHAHDAGGNVLLDFGAGEQMTLNHVNVASLHPDDFLL